MFAWWHLDSENGIDEEEDEHDEEYNLHSGVLLLGTVDNILTLIVR